MVKSCTRLYGVHIPAVYATRLVDDFVATRFSEGLLKRLPCWEAAFQRGASTPISPHRKGSRLKTPKYGSRLTPKKVSSRSVHYRLGLSIL
jgi:hypothetical protein